MPNKSKTKKLAKPVKLNLGCGVNLLSGFINVDKFITEEELREGSKTHSGVWKNVLYPDDATFLQTDMLELPFKDNSVDYIECLEALEHLPYKDVEVAVAEMYRVLKPGAELCLCVPDFNDIAHVWTEKIADHPWDPYAFFGMVQQVFGNQLHLGEHHKAAFNETYLSGLLEAVGFDPEKTAIDARKHNEQVPTFKGAKWDPEMVLIIGMLTATAIK